MTEFVLMPKACYLNEKGSTRHEYDSVMEEDDRRWAELMGYEQGK